MKKSLIFLPLACLVLTGCGEEKFSPLDPEIPSGGEKVDITDPTKKDEINEKIVRNLKTTYTSFRSGFDVDGNIKVNQLSSSGEGLIVNTSNLGFTYSLKARDLDKKISEWNIATEIKDFTGSITFGAEDDKNKKTIDASSLSAKMYISGGNVYADLSNPGILSTANTLIEYFITGTEVAFIKQLAISFCKQIKLGNVVDLLEIEDVELIPEMNESISNKIQEGVKELLETKEEGFSFDIFDYKENEVAITFGGSHFENSEITSGGAKIKESSSTTVNANVVFDKTGNLAKTYANVKAEESKKEGEITRSAVVADIELGAVMNYKTSELELPDFSTFEEFPIGLFLGK